MLKTAFLLTEMSDTETPIIGLVTEKPTFDLVLEAMKTAIADHFDVDVDDVEIVNGSSIERGIPVWVSDTFDVVLGVDIADAVIEVRSIYVY